jgi:hypothetical protein
MGKKRNGENITCNACEKIFYVPQYRIKTAKFCSLFCQNHLRYDKSKFKCLECGTEFQDSPSRKGLRKFCSISCDIQNKTKRKIDVRENRRKHIEIQRKKGNVSKHGPSIRKFVLSIKDKRCEICFFEEYECCLDIHHADNDPNNNSLKNLMVLCVMCHRKVHRKIINLK